MNERKILPAASMRARAGIMPLAQYGNHWSVLSPKLLPLPPSRG